MPYRIVRDGNKHCLENERTGKRAPGSCHKDRAKTRAMMQAINISEHQQKAGNTAVFLTRAADGQRLIGLLSSNAYIDKDGDAAALESLQTWVDSQWQGDEYVGKGVVLFWHDGEPVADIVYSAVEGAFLVEIAKARATPFADALFEAIEKVSESQDFGASIGALAVRQFDERRVFHVQDKPETSILPVLFAGNEFTHMEILKMNTAQKLARRLWLRKYAPKASDIEEKLRKAAEEATDKLDGEGLERKSASDIAVIATLLEEMDKARMLDVSGLAQSLTEMVGELLGEKAPEDLAEQITKQVEAHISDESIEDEAMDAYEEEKATRTKLVDLLDTLTDQLAEFSSIKDDADKMTGLPAAIEKQLSPISTVVEALADVGERLEAVEGVLKGEVTPASANDKTIVRKNNKLVEKGIGKARERDTSDPWNRIYKHDEDDE